MRDKRVEPWVNSVEKGWERLRPARAGKASSCKTGPARAGKASSCKTGPARRVFRGRCARPQDPLVIRRLSAGSRGVAQQRRVKRVARPDGDGSSPPEPWARVDGCAALGGFLTRDDHVQLDGLVTQVFAGGQFEVKTDAGAIVRAQLSGRMRKNRIRVILGDRVTVALSPYDLTHGMITYRHK